MHLWLDDDQIVGIVIVESPASVFLQIHPAHRSLEAALLDWAEAHLLPNIEVWAEADDTSLVAKCCIRRVSAIVRSTFKTRC